MRRHAVCRQFTNTRHATNQSSMMLWCELKHLCVCVCVCVCVRAGYGTVEQRENPPRNESFTQRDASWNLSLTYVGASCRQLDFRIILERARWLILGWQAALNTKKVLAALKLSLGHLLFFYLYVMKCMLMTVFSMCMYVLYLDILICKNSQRIVYERISAYTG